MWTGGTHGRKRKECGEARYIEERKDRKEKEGHKNQWKRQSEKKGRQNRGRRKKGENFRKEKEVERGSKWRGGERE